MIIIVVLFASQSLHFCVSEFPYVRVCTINKTSDLGTWKSYSIREQFDIEHYVVKVKVRPFLHVPQYKLLGPTPI